MNKTLAKSTAGAFLVSTAMIGAPMTLHYEGMKLKPYYDSVGKLTWCAGETEVGYKKEFSKSECDFLYTVRYGYYSMKTMEFYNDKASAVVTPQIHAAMTDMSYNVGLGTVRNSSMVKALNRGDAAGACEAILLYKYAGGKDCSDPKNRSCPGIWTRRLEMNKLCRAGVDSVSINFNRS